MAIACSRKRLSSATPSVAPCSPPPAPVFAVRFGMREFLFLELLPLLMLTGLLLLPPLRADSEDKPLGRLLSTAFAFSFSYVYDQFCGV